MKRRRTIGYKPQKSVYNRTFKLVPALLLAGNWFREAGFEVGSSVTVTVEKGRIIIE